MKQMEPTEKPDDRNTTHLTPLQKASVFSNQVWHRLQLFPQSLQLSLTIGCAQFYQGVQIVRAALSGHLVIR